MKNAVLISCFDWYEMRLKPIKVILEQKGYSVTVFTSDYDHFRKKKINKRNQDCTYIKVKEYKKNISAGRLYSHYSFAEEVYTRLNMIRPILVYALVPPNSVASVCRKYKQKNPNTQLILDVIDMWPESIPYQRLHGTYPFKYWKNLRDKNLKAADHVFAECNFYQEQFDSDIRDKSSTLYLFKNEDVFDKKMDKGISQVTNGIDKTIIRLCYLGSINNIIDINGICDVVRQLKKEYTVEIRVIGKGEKKDTFLNALNNCGANTTYYGPIYEEEEKFRILGDCDFALNMMIESVYVGLTIKSIDYLSYGLPLINNIKGDTWNLVEKANIGINYCRNGDLIKDLHEHYIISHSAINKIFRDMFSKEAFIESFKRGMKNVLY